VRSRSSWNRHCDVLKHLPDAAALIRVDHRKRTIELVHLFDEYGGVGEAAQWDEAQRLAGAALDDA
jgi:hypothetical protein